jgi:hypothetical protein
MRAFTCHVTAFKVSRAGKARTCWGDWRQHSAVERPQAARHAGEAPRGTFTRIAGGAASSSSFWLLTPDFFSLGGVRIPWICTI